MWFSLEDARLDSKKVDVLQLKYNKQIMSYTARNGIPYKQGFPFIYTFSLKLDDTMCKTQYER